MTKIKKLYILFITTFFISLTANSGYAILSVMKNIVVNKYKWFTNEEMADFTALAQSAPGPVAINSSMIIGYKVAGLIGGFIAVLGCFLPPLIIMSIISYFYKNIIDNKQVILFLKGMQAGVIAMLLDFIIDLFLNIKKEKDYFLYLIIIISFILVYFTSFKIFYLVVTCILIGIIKSLYFHKELKK